MPKRTVALLVEDMLQACDRIVRYTESITFDKILNDTKSADITVRNIQILGKAAGQISEDLQRRHPDTEMRS